MDDFGARLLEVLRDPALQSTLQVVACCIAALLPLVGWFFRRFFRPSRRLSVNVEVFSLVSLPDNVHEYIGIFIHEQKVTNPKILSVRLTNSGREPIERTDFDVPLLLRPGGGAAVISANYIHPSEEHKQPSLDVTSEWVKVSPALLNTRDYWEIALVVSGGDETLNVTGHIKGIGDLKGKHINMEITRLRLGLGSFLWLATGVGYFARVLFTLAHELVPDSWLEFLANLVIFTGAYVLVFHLLSRISVSLLRKRFSFLLRDI